MSSPKRLYVPLLASAARSASGNQEVLDTTTSPAGNPQSYGLSRYARCLILLDVTAAAVAVGDTLDVYIQKDTGRPGARIYTDFVHFTQVLGNGGPKQFVAEINANLSSSTLHPIQDAAVVAGGNNGPWGDYWRVKWVTAGTGPNFTFQVSAWLEAET